MKNVFRFRVFQQDNLLFLLRYAGNLKQNLLHFRWVRAIGDRYRDRDPEFRVRLGIIHNDIGRDLVVRDGDDLVIQGLSRVLRGPTARTSP